MAAAMGCWAGNDALVKLCAHDLSVTQILAIRGLFASALALTLVLLARERLQPRALTRPAVALRCTLELATAASATWALAHAPLGVVTAITMTAPMLAVLGAQLLGWEARAWTRLLGVLAGLFGALLVVQPWQNQQPPLTGVAAAFICALCLAARDLSTRRLAQTLSARAMTLLTSATVGLAGLGVWQATAPATPITPSHWGLLAGAALCATAGNLLLVAALRSTHVGRVMPLRFSLLLWSTLLGMLIWQERTSALTWIGLVLIAATGAAALRKRTPLA
ncbi:DMT family transporter [uncultured Pseudacidovorax sp.]|uniref:DMT family transporter n=1 Tax=uncultured Pseudacidovorax sp. TaxID=679313 RepID=UPI0025D9CAE0|nr:DMT family transporter [uncultured Pseudacidovorax sp.]